MEVLAEFDAQDASALYGRPTAARLELFNALQDDSSMILEDFRDGITPLTPPASTTDNSVHVHAGDHSNVALAAGSSSMTMRDQHVTSSVNDEEALAALAELAKLIANSALSADEKSEGLDAVTLARVEITGEKDPSRLKRYTAKLGNFAVEVGASALGGTIAAYATAALLSAGMI